MDTNQLLLHLFQTKGEKFTISKGDWDEAFKQLKPINGVVYLGVKNYEIRVDPNIPKQEMTIYMREHEKCPFCHNHY